MNLGDISWQHFKWTIKYFSQVRLVVTRLYSIKNRRKNISVHSLWSALMPIPWDNLSQFLIYHLISAHPPIGRDHLASASPKVSLSCNNPIACRSGDQQNGETNIWTFFLLPSQLYIQIVYLIYNYSLILTSAFAKISPNCRTNYLQWNSNHILSWFTGPTKVEWP